MKVLVIKAPHRLEWEEREKPRPGEGQVRIRTLAVGICATDLRVAQGASRVGFPVIPGHEWSGIVEAVGPGVPESLVGQRCVGENVLSDGGEVGFEHPGGYGECFLTEAARLRQLPDFVSAECGTLVEPLAVTVRAARRLRAEPGHRALIFGDGPIGLLMAALLARRGLSAVAMVGGREPRLALAKELGVQAVCNYHSFEGGDLVRGVAAALGRDFARVVEASGSAAAASAALRLASPEGRVLVAGDYGDAAVDATWTMILHRELELVGSNASAGAWDEALEIVRERTLPLDRLVSHVFPVGRYAEAMETARKDGTAVKVVLTWEAAQGKPA